jgi:broad specificity phosphatase PhoE
MKSFVLLLLTFVVVSIASAEPIVVIVRHAEKAANDPKNPDLSPAGQNRAETLAGILKDAHISAIFTTEFKRTQETAAPLSKSTGVVPSIVSAKDYPALLAKLHQVDGAALVVGHGDTIPDIIKALGIDTPLQIPEDDYTNLLVVTLQPRPQLLRLHY